MPSLPNANLDAFPGGIAEKMAFPSTSAAPSPRAPAGVMTPAGGAGPPPPPPRPGGGRCSPRTTSSGSSRRLLTAPSASWRDSGRRLLRAADGDEGARQERERSEQRHALLHLMSSTAGLKACTTILHHRSDPIDVAI